METDERYSGAERRTIKARWKDRVIGPLASRDLLPEHRRANIIETPESNILWALADERRVKDRRRQELPGVLAEDLPEDNEDKSLDDGD